MKLNKAQYNKKIMKKIFLDNEEHECLGFYKGTNSVMELVTILKYTDSWTKCQQWQQQIVFEVYCTLNGYKA
jgi:hypothetical protein